MVHLTKKEPSGLMLSSFKHVVFRYSGLYHKTDSIKNQPFFTPWEVNPRSQCMLLTAHHDVKIPWKQGFIWRHMDCYKGIASIHKKYKSWNVIVNERLSEWISFLNKFYGLTIFYPYWEGWRISHRMIGE